MQSPVAVVLAAGQGARMQSNLPKVLLPIAGRPLVDYVLDALQAAGIERMLVVVGYRADLVREALADRPGVEFVVQDRQLGTGHAVSACGEQLESHDGPVVVVAGDSPMLQPSSLVELLKAFGEERPACLLGTLHKKDPHGLGRIVRDSAGQFSAIVEHRDATDEQQRITEVNMSTYVFDCRRLFEALGRLSCDNRQQEYYLTDCPGILNAAGHTVRAMAVLKPREALSVNTPDELAVVQAKMREMS